MSIFSSLFSRLFDSGGREVAERAVSGLARSAINNYGDDVARTALSGIGRKLVSDYGDDAARAVASKAAPAVTDDIARNVVGSTTKGGGKIASKIADALDAGVNDALNVGNNLTRYDLQALGDNALDNAGKLYRRTGLSDTADQVAFGKTLTGGAQNKGNGIVKGEEKLLDRYTNKLRYDKDTLNNLDLSDLAEDIDGLLSTGNKYVAGKVREMSAPEMADFFAGEAKNMSKVKDPSEWAKFRQDKMNEISHAINERIEAGIPKETVQSAWSDMIDELDNAAVQARQSGNTKYMKAYDRLAREAEGVPIDDRTLAGMRNFKSDFVLANKIAKKNAVAMGGGTLEGAGGLAGSIIPRPLRRAASAVVNKPIEAGVRKAAEAADYLSKKVRSGEAGDLLKNAAVVGGAVAGLNALGGSNAQAQSDARAQGYSAPGTQPQGNYPSDTSSLAPVTGAQQNTIPSATEPTLNGYSMGDLEDGYAKALMAGDSASAKAISSMIDVLDNRITRQSKAQTAATKTRSGTGSSSTPGSVNAILGLYRQAGGGRGAGGVLTSLLNKLTFGAYNPQAAAYEAQAPSMATALARLSGEKGVLSDLDIRNYGRMVPSTSDSDAAAQAKIRAIYDRLRASG